MGNANTYCGFIDFPLIFSEFQSDRHATVSLQIRPLQ